eukprot:268765_1
MGCSVSTIDNDTDTHAQNTGTPTAITTEQNTPIQHKLVIFGYIRELSVNSNHYQHIPFNIYKICYKFYLMKYEVGDYLDVRDRWGKWHEAIVQTHIPAREEIPFDALLTEKQRKDIDKLKHLEALYVQYKPYNPWNEFEWIFIDTHHTICTCLTRCNTDKTEHRVAAHNTQSKFNDRSKGGIRSSFLYKPTYKRAKPKFGPYNAVFGGGWTDTRIHGSGADVPKKRTNIRYQRELVVVGYIREHAVILNQHIPFQIQKICFEFYLMILKFKFEVGDYLDVRDGVGQWYEAIVKIHKPANHDMPRNAPVENKRYTMEMIDNLKHLDALYVHYTAWDNMFDEWIFIERHTICECSTVCKTDREMNPHRIAVHNTQIKFKLGSSPFAQRRAREQIQKEEERKENWLAHAQQIRAQELRRNLFRIEQMAARIEQRHMLNMFD